MFKTAREAEREAIEARLKERMVRTEVSLMAGLRLLWGEASLRLVLYSVHGLWQRKRRRRINFYIIVILEKEIIHLFHGRITSHIFRRASFASKQGGLRLLI